MGYWHGSGTLGYTVTRSFSCGDFDGDAKDCKGQWEDDFETDDWGNVYDKTTCPICKTEFTYVEND